MSRENCLKNFSQNYILNTKLSLHFYFINFKIVAFYAPPPPVKHTRKFNAVSVLSHCYDDKEHFYKSIEIFLQAE
ncbi:MAG: hypothetical protein IJS29_02200 [Selenomonadaceae bacterium]|nr:hypothetical protein [Selenomonadaceae bacterium]